MDGFVVGRLRFGHLMPICGQGAWRSACRPKGASQKSLQVTDVTEQADQLPFEHSVVIVSVRVLGGLSELAVGLSRWLFCCLLRWVLGSMNG